LKSETWLPLYQQICADFGFDPAKDLRSADMLASMLRGRGSKSLEAVKRGFPKSVLVCGGSLRLADELSSMTFDGFVVAADSATTVLMESGIRINMIVTDLDGIVEDQIQTNREGATVFVHAHGDNQNALSRYVKEFPGPLVGTCQCPPPKGLFNFGGFTDGDRAACIAASLGATTIVLAGFDFENPSDKAGKSREIKKRKLRWAKVILDTLAREGVRLVSAGDLPSVL